MELDLLSLYGKYSRNLAFVRKSPVVIMLLAAEPRDKVVIYSGGEDSKKVIYCIGSIGGFTFVIKYI